MAGAVAITERLHRVLARLDASDDPDFAWLAETARLWLAGAPWESALGLHNGWRDVLSQRAQERALSGLLAALPPMKIRSAAREIAAMLRAYETTTWHADRAAGRRPSGAKGWLFEYLAADGPTSFERIRKLIPGSPRRAT